MKKFGQSAKKLWHHRAHRSALVSGLALIAVGASWGILSLGLRADTATTVSFQAEAGTKTGVTTVSDASAAGGSAVRFGAATNPDPLTCNLNATAANFAAQVSAATAGQVICLATGNYGTWLGVNKAITITKQPGATPTMDVEFNNGDAGFTIDGLSGMGGTMTGGPKNITIRNSTFTDPIVMMQLSNANVLLDNNTHNNIDIGSSCTGWPARVMVSESTGAAGVTISNSYLSGGNTDGIKIDSSGVTVIGSQFIDIKEKSENDCAHTDSIQFNGAGDAIIRNNYFRGGSNGIVAFDRTYNNLISGNVCVNLARGSCVDLYSDTDSVVEHNVAFGGMEALHLDRKLSDPVGRGTIFRNNIGELGAGNGSTAAVNTNNLYSGANAPNINGSPIYVGGANPTTWAGFKLAPGSPGKGAATDGLDIGIN